MTRVECTRCDNGWFQHPTQAWAVSCPNCGPAVTEYWNPGRDGKGVVTHVRPPASHESQQEVPMPEYCRDIVREALERIQRRERLALSDRAAS